MLKSLFLLCSAGSAFYKPLPLILTSPLSFCKSASTKADVPCYPALLPLSHLPQWFCSCFLGLSNCSRNDAQSTSTYILLLDGIKLFYALQDKYMEKGEPAVSEGDSGCCWKVSRGWKTIPMGLSGKCSYCATHQDSLHQLTWCRIKLCLSQIHPVFQSEHLTRVFCQVRIVVENLQGRCAILCFISGPITVTDDNRTRGQGFRQSLRGN